MGSYVVRESNPRLSRLEKGIELEQIVRDTKIPLRYLVAIEGQEFEKLPGGVYNINYIRQYAQAIGYDESELLSLYRSKVPPEPGVREDPDDDPPGDRTSRLLGIPIPFAARWRTVPR